jgi:hypothetical protein
MNTTTETIPEPVDVEAIMREIRAEILAKKGTLTPGGEPIVPTAGHRLPPEFYDHLYQAALAYREVGVKMHVTPVNAPLLGPVVTWLRGKLHELVLFYVNQVAAQQVRVNTHLLHAVSLLSQELEKTADEDPTA